MNFDTDMIPIRYFSKSRNFDTDTIVSKGSVIITTQKIRCFLNNFLADDGCVLRTHTHVRCYISRDEKKSVVVVYETPLMTYVVTASSAPLHMCVHRVHKKSSIKCFLL